LSEENDSNVNKKSLKFKAGVVCLILVLIITSTIAIYFARKNYYSALKYSNEYHTLIETSTLDAKTAKTDLANEKIRVAEMAAELEKMKDRIAGIKDKDDLLKRDIEFYIRNTYTKVPRVVAKTIAENVVEQAKKENVSAELVVGIIEVESVFNPMAIGPKTKYGNARGLMQVMPEWAKKFNLENVHDLHYINTNITCGIKVFKIHLEEGKGKISEGLYFYVNKDRSYVDKVYRAMGKFVSFRSTVDDDEKSENGNGHEKEGNEGNTADTKTKQNS